jgi:hypothetical protein
MNTPIPALTNKDHAKYIRRKSQDGFRLKYALGNTERKDLVKDCGVHALVLFEYYLRLASTENAVITDEHAADYFTWSVHTAKRWRVKLQKMGWMLTEKAKLPNGRRIVVYYLGKDEVLQSGNLNPKREVKPVAMPEYKLPTDSLFDR